MCGIAGCLVFDNSAFRVSEPYLIRMRDAMAHRGPDAAGLWISHDRRVGLGHRRLAILDLSPAANQPMSDREGNLQLVYNGEIYNHAEVRAELERAGDTGWKTDHSDTEVVLRAFRRWGIECLHKFVGMYAFAVWDAGKRELWCVRDRLGIKPLYYSIHHGRLTFASEIKALLEDPEQARTLNEESLFHYLSFETSPPPHTMFEGIEKLPCGTWMKVTSEGAVVHQQYWDVFDDVDLLTGATDDELADKVLSELRLAVKRRKISDVPMGVFLSGGVDSSANAALFSEGQDGPIDTFCVGYEGADYHTYTNETHHARLMADHVAATHHERLLTCHDFINLLPVMIRLQDEPIADPVCFPVYCVSQLARERGMVVCQVGEGADELFCGYPFWKLALRLQHMNDWPVPTLLKSALLRAMRGVGQVDSLAYEALRRGVRREPIFWGGAEAFTHAQKISLLSPRLRSRFLNLTSWEALRPIRQRFEERSPDRSHLGWMSYLDLNYRLPELLLMRMDKMSMGVSLETRVPFLDHNLVSLAMSIPEGAKTRGGEIKRILKQAVRGIVPDQLIDRRKQGFNVPVYEWLAEGLGERIKGDLREFCRETDIFDSSTIEQHLQRPIRKQLWYLENFALWWKEYIAG